MRGARTEWRRGRERSGRRWSGLLLRPRRADRCRLTIQDNGVGFEPESIEDYGGYGLANMRDRLEKINGSLAIDSQPGQGTTLDIEVIR